MPAQRSAAEAIADSNWPVNQSPPLPDSLPARLSSIEGEAETWDFWMGKRR